jgi:transcriptional regulator with XRE-family HTH domain
VHCINISAIDQYPVSILPINAAQVRMARAALQMSVRDLAARVGVAPGTIVRIEAGKPAFESTLEKLELVLFAAGVEFYADKTGWSVKLGRRE